MTILILHFYVVDTVGIIQNKIKLLVSNKDWEEIAHDNNYIYLGDFRNNSAGIGRSPHFKNREIDRETNPNIDTIAFSYSDQIDFI
jgi:hypothetical protein